tara:strand:+ start:860 stop:1216 length:357 start_codon:yes stop_codon:yes gene_type:complete
MHKILENWNNFLKEEQSVFTMQLVIKAEPGTKLYGRVFEAIRGIEGVTVIRSMKQIERDEAGNKVMLLSVRFYVNPAFMATYVDNLRKAISRLSDADGDDIISVKIFKNPQKMDDVFT